MPQTTDPADLLLDMSALTEEGDAIDNAVVEELAIKGEFADGSIKALTKAVNSLLPSFGVEEPLDEGAVSEDGTVPMEVSRYVLSIRDAVNDAIEADILDADMSINLDEVIDDTAMASLTARIRMAAADKGFKRWLAEDAPEEEAPAPEPEVEDTSEADDDALLMSRI